MSVMAVFPRILRIRVPPHQGRFASLQARRSHRLLKAERAHEHRFHTYPDCTIKPVQMTSVCRR
jgi:hypothetical protein